MSMNDVNGNEIEVVKKEGVIGEVKAGKSKVEFVVDTTIDLATLVMFGRRNYMTLLVRAGMKAQSASGMATKAGLKGDEQIAKQVIVDKYSVSKSEYREAILKLLGVNLLAMASTGPTHVAGITALPPEYVGVEFETPLDLDADCVILPTVENKLTADKAKELQEAYDELEVFQQKIAKVAIADGKSVGMALSIAKRSKECSAGSKYTVTILSNGKFKPALI